MNSATLSLRRHLKIGAVIGAVLGFAFGTAVVALADCSGPHCFGERVMGVVGHGLAGAVAGALAGGAVHLVRRVTSR